MRIVIVEDEELAAEGLITQLKRVEPTAEVLVVLDSVKSALKWFAENPAPELAFFDIQLADGISFEIFERVSITCPVIFTTAYDAYALRAFQVNSIDYLLKPVDAAALKRAFEKLRLLAGAGERAGARPAPAAAPSLDLIRQLISRTTPKYKTRFMVKVGERLSAFTTDDIDCFWGENKVVWMRLKTGRKYMVDYTLEELEDMLDPEHFYRLNRKYLVTFGAIKEVIAYSNSRLKVILRDSPDPEDILVSREKAEDFRIWLGK
jgi:two-component system LytT family response regulator